MTATRDTYYGARLFSNDPIVTAALRLNGLDIASLPWPDENDDGERIISLYGSWGTETNGDDVRPFVIPKMRLFFNGEALLSWNRPATFLRYDVDSQGGIITMPDTKLPETSLAGLTGKTLNTVIDIPGADQMVIGVAVNSAAFVSDPIDLRMAVERAV